MSRLVDIDTLRKNFKVAEQCGDCPQREENCVLDRVFACRDVCGILDDAPTIDAIPVDWLTDRINETARPKDDNDIELNHALFWTSVEWERWKKEHVLDDCIVEIGEQQAIDAEPVQHGQWIETTIPANTTGHGGMGQDKKKGWLCSNCRCAFDAKLLWCDNYCPNCGAKMEERKMNNNDLISRVAAIDALTDQNIEKNSDNVYDGELHRTKRAAIRIIANMPTIDAEPVRHGCWVKMTGMLPPEYHGHYECSECQWHMKGLRNSWTHEEEFAYCPCCGAKMDGDIQDE